jgi:hypothetical protein
MSSDGAETDAVALQERRARELYDAVKDSDEHQVRGLVAAGYDVNALAMVDGDKANLESAIEQRNDAIAMLLIKAGARLINYKFPLQMALKSTALCRTAVALLRIVTEVRT